MGAAIACALSVSLTSCDDDDDDEPTPSTNTGGSGTASGAPEKLIGLDITSNTTWSKDTIYILTSRIRVLPNVTLTINPGTIVKGSEGQGANAKVLMVMRDAKIMADGTASEPIIFTSTKDQIQPGQIASPNLPNDLVGQWGGLAILGNGIIASKNRDATNSFDVQQIEGVPATDTTGLYGGTNNSDNSGILRYVSVRHGGTSIGAGNELNGISFGGVGSGTIVENIEIVANADDGVEFYGGAVNAKNVVVWNNGDDAVDTDNGYIGTIDNGFVVGPAGSAFELDGPEGTTTSINMNHTIKNFTVVSVRGDGTNAEDLLNFDANTNITFQNVHYVAPGAQKLNVNNVDAATGSFSNITLNVTAANLANYYNTADADLVSAVAVGSTGAANATPFANWTWAGTANDLSALK